MKTQEQLVSIDKVCEFLEEHLFTNISKDDANYGETYVTSDFSTVYDLISGLYKAMEE